MNNKGKLIIAVLIFAGFIAGASILYGVLKDKTAEDSNDKGTEATDTSDNNSATDKIKADDFTVLDKDGNSVNLSDYIGKPLVVNFWASWCPPCKSEMPDFNEVYKEMGEEITFMMVDMTDGSRETIEKAQSFVEDKGYSFPVYFDTKQDAAYTYKVYSIPTTLFIDKDGNLVETVKIAMTKKVLLQNIEKINSK